MGCWRGTSTSRSAVCSADACNWLPDDSEPYPDQHRAHQAAVLADALAPTIAAREAAAEARALRVVRQVEADMSEHALAAWRSADARSGLSDHDALLTHADALTRWSERFRMAFDGDYYAAAARGVEGIDQRRCAACLAVPTLPCAAHRDRPACTGASDCHSGLHEHGCYADLDGSACNDPDDHTPPAEGAGR